MLRIIPSSPDYAADEHGSIWLVSNPRKGSKYANRELPCRVNLTRRDNGYLKVCVGGRAMRNKQRFVHCLVLEAFVGTRPDGMQACHNNGVNTDNRPSNLRWDTPTANARERDNTRVVRNLRPGYAILAPADVEWVNAYPKSWGMFRAMQDRLQVSEQTIRKAYYSGAKL